MTDEAKLNADVTRANRAKALMEDSLLVEAFATIRQTYIDKLIASEARDSDARERLYVAVRVVGQVQDHLNAVMANGKLAEAELKRLTEDMERKKRFKII